MFIPGCDANHARCRNEQDLSPILAHHPPKIFYRLHKCVSEILAVDLFGSLKSKTIGLNI